VSASPAAPARPLPPVRFVKYYQKGSTDTAADQMVPPLLARGVDVRAVWPAEARAMRGAILVFIKRADLRDLVVGKLRGNRLVVDVHDTIVFKRGVRWSRLYDGMIFRNRRGCEDFGRRNAVNIPHHWDERYRLHEAPLDRLRTAYIGEPRSLPFEVPGVELVFTDWFRQALAFNCHLSLRRPGREWLYKPNMKSVTAAACGAVLVTTRDESAREHLGDDYPFYTEPDRESVIAALAHAERSMGGPEWQRALATLAAVRERLTLDRVTDLYLDLFARLAPAPPLTSG
jgi:hypothetical protein